MQALDVFSILQQLPPNICQAAEVQFSVQVYAALGAGNVRAFLRMRAEASWRCRQLMDIQLNKANTTCPYNRRFCSWNKVKFCNSKRLSELRHNQKHSSCPVSLFWSPQLCLLFDWLPVYHMLVYCLWSCRALPAYWVHCA